MAGGISEYFDSILSDSDRDSTDEFIDELCQTILEDTQKENAEIVFVEEKPQPSELYLPAEE